MFGQIPGAPTPPNLSPLDSTPPHASLFSRYNDLRASSYSQSSLSGSSKTMRSAAPTIPQPVRPGFPSRTKHELLHVNTTHHHRAQPENTGPASGGRRLRFWGRLLKRFRVSFHTLLCIPKRPETETERLEPTPSVSRFFFPLRVLLWGCRSNHHPEQAWKYGRCHQWRRRAATGGKLGFGRWRERNFINTEQQ
jgi:hypothetical protein